VTTTTTDLTDTVRRCYETQDWDGLAALYASDVVLDMHPPGWRFQTQGADAASAQWNAITGQFQDLRVTWVRATPTDGGVIVEWEMHTGHGDSEHLCRQVDILHGDGATFHRARRLLRRHVERSHHRPPAGRSTDDPLVNGPCI
jgi:hypothetical protein